MLTSAIRNQEIPRRSTDTSKGSLSDATVVIFSIETTNSKRNRGICQISAICDNKYFDQYIMPDKENIIFDDESFEIQWCWRKLERILLFRGEEQTALPPKDGLKRFLRFLKQQNGKILLAAHNCFLFQGPVLVQQMKRYGLSQAFEEHVVGFIDTNTIFKSIKKRRREKNLSFTLHSLAKDIFGIDIYSDDCGKVSVVEELLRVINCTDAIMKQHARPLNELVVLSAPSDTAIVIFSIETTNSTRNKGICQITASCNNNSFEQYIIPEEEISPEISEMNGFEIKWSLEERKLLFRGQEQNEALPPKKGLKEFLHFLKQQNAKVLLAAHNCFTFQGHVIVRQMKRYGLFHMFEKLVVGFIDTIQVFGSILKRRKEKKQSFALHSLAEDYLGLKMNDDNRSKDLIIDELLEVTNCTDAIMKQHARPLHEFIRKMPENFQSAVDDLEPLKETVSKTMLARMAKAGITLNVLMKVLEENGKQGVINFLAEDIQGKPKVTKNAKINQAIINKLQALKSKIEVDVPHKKRRLN